MEIQTIHGPVDEARLARTVTFEDRPDKFAILIAYRLDDELVRQDAYPVLKTVPNERGDISTTLGEVPASTLQRSVQFFENATEFVVAVEFHRDGALVRRDANVILKQSVEASAIAAALV